MSRSPSPPSSSDPGRSRAAGFTLIEVLVAVTMAATVLAAVYGIFASVSNAKSRLETDVEAYHQARVVFDRLGREIRGAVPTGGPGGKGVFRGGRDSQLYPYLELTTTAVAQQVEGTTGIALVRYDLDVDTESPGERVLVLQRSEQSVLQETAGSSRSGRLRMVKGIEELDIRFLDKNGWGNEWDSSKTDLPALVEVAMTITDRAGRTHRFLSAFELSGISWKR